ILRCNWGLWLTGFATNMAFALTFLFVYYPLVAPPPVAAAPTALPASPTDEEESELLPPAQEIEVLPPPSADDDDMPPDVGETADPLNGGGASASAPSQTPTFCRWRPQFGASFILLGTILLLLGASWGTYLDYRRAESQRSMV